MIRLRSTELGASCGSFKIPHVRVRGGGDIYSPISPGCSHSAYLWFGHIIHCGVAFLSLRNVGNNQQPGEGSVREYAAAKAQYQEDSPRPFPWRENLVSHKR